MSLTNKQHQELETWIAKNVMMCKEVSSPKDLVVGTFYIHPDFGVLLPLVGVSRRHFHPTINRDTAMVVLEKILDDFKHPDSFIVCKQDREFKRYENYFSISKHQCGKPVREFPIDAATLPLAICLFAKQQYSN